MEGLIIPALVSLAVCSVLTPVLIPVLHRLNFGQQIREEGPEGHKKKSGTPTMGGIAFLAAITAGSLLSLIWSPETLPQMLPVLLMMVGYGAIGLADDLLKILKKQSEGLKAWQKFAAQLLLTLGFAWYRMSMVEGGTLVAIPFTDIMMDFGWFYIPFLVLVVVGTDNGVNFTDGLDGLCSSVTAVVAVFLAVLSLRDGGGVEAVSLCTAAALAGFLLYNTNPAGIFMGDTGSLALGAFVSSAALTLRQPFLILLIGIIYLAEVVSVMLQVGWFKATHGKRLFKMAPIHHHFELCGWSEPRIVTVFTVITAAGCLLAYWGA